MYMYLLHHISLLKMKQETSSLTHHIGNKCSGLQGHYAIFPSLSLKNISPKRTRKNTLGGFRRCHLHRLLQTCVYYCSLTATSSFYGLRPQPTTREVQVAREVIFQHTPKLIGCLIAWSMTLLNIVNIYSPKGIHTAINIHTFCHKYMLIYQENVHIVCVCYLINIH